MTYVAKIAAKDSDSGLDSTMLVGSALYGECTTAASTAAKTVSISGFDELMTGVTIHVRFANTNTASNPTLNVSSQGAKPIYRFGTTYPGTSEETSWKAGAVVSFTYNNSNNTNGCWVMNDNVAIDVEDLDIQKGTLPDGTAVMVPRDSGIYSISSSNTHTGLPDGINYGVLFQGRSKEESAYNIQLMTSFTQDTVRGLLRMRKNNDPEWTKWSEMLLCHGVLYDGAVISSIYRPGIFYLLGTNTYTGWGTSWTNSGLHQYGVLIVIEPMLGSDVTAQLLITDNGYGIRYYNGTSWSEWIITELNSHSQSITKTGLTCVAEKKSNAVTIHISGNTSAELSTNNAFWTLGTLDAQYRPSIIYDTNAMLVLGTTGARYGRVQVGTDGVVKIGYTSSLSGTAANATIASGAAVRFSGTYVC